MSVRYFVEIKYDGTNYHGWQFQPNSISVQETINTELNRLLQSQIAMVGCGRTDTGVHASKYYFHFDFPEQIDVNLIAFKLNHMVPADISIVRIFEVSSDLHARFSAKSRTYHYFINFYKDPFDRFHSFYYTRELDVEVMNKACELLIGIKDFTSFSKTNTETKTNLCEVTEAYWILDDSRMIFVISANRFLRNMVRAIVGTMLDVGTHKITLEEFNNIIEAKDRTLAGKSAPGQGLFLSDVIYNFDINEN